jgi:hypothetical protein
LNNNKKIIDVKSENILMRIVIEKCEKSEKNKEISA